MKGEMWIDGEYFINPVHILRIEKAIALVKCTVDTAVMILRLTESGMPEEVIASLVEADRVRLGVMLHQQLFPPTGGIIVTPCAPSPLIKVSESVNLNTGVKS